MKHFIPCLLVAVFSLPAVTQDSHETKRTMVMQGRSLDELRAFLDWINTRENPAEFITQMMKNSSGSWFAEHLLKAQIIEHDGLHYLAVNWDGDLGELPISSESASHDSPLCGLFAHFYDAIYKSSQVVAINSERADIERKRQRLDARIQDLSGGMNVAEFLSTRHDMEEERLRLELQIAQVDARQEIVRAQLTEETERAEARIAQLMELMRSKFDAKIEQAKRRVELARKQVELKLTPEEAVARCQLEYEDLQAQIESERAVRELEIRANESGGSPRLRQMLSQGDVEHAVLLAKFEVLGRHLSQSAHSYPEVIALTRQITDLERQDSDLKQELTRAQKQSGVRQVKTSYKRAPDT